MKKSTKIIIGAIAAVFLAGIGVGVWFLVKPAEGQSKIKDGKTYTFTNGKWVLDIVQNPTNIATQPTPTPYTGGGSSSGSDSVKALQRLLNSKGANLVVDGIMGDKTRTAMAKYGVDANGNSTTPNRSIGKGDKLYATKKIGIYDKAGDIMKYAEANQYLGIVNQVMISVFELGSATTGFYYVRKDKGDVYIKA